MNTRSRISLRWSTAPRHVGYAAPHESKDLTAEPVDFVGTPRQLVSEMARIRRNIGAGTLFATHMTHKGQQVNWEDILAAIDAVDLHTHT